MSFLAPLYALGLLAIAAPVLFHLIRRRPKGQVQFSSLMFLSPSPPRFSRRSRLDHLLLLALRAATLALLALAFMQPFFRAEAPLDLGGAGSRRVAVLIDTSASMRRGDLWQRAVAQAGAVLAGCRPADQVAVFAFDAASRPVLDFRESATLEPTPRQAVARDRLQRLAPTWAGTDLGRALSEVLGAVDDGVETKPSERQLPRRIVVVSDLQQGTRLEALRGLEWPADVELELKVISDEAGNAGLDLLQDRAEESADGKTPLRVRVFNDPATRNEKFTLSWVDPHGGSAEGLVEAYVPPGESRVVRVARPARASSQRVLRLQGDSHPFDNTLFVPDVRREEMTVFYLGADAAADPSGLRFYLEGVFAAQPGRTVHVVSPEKDADWENVRSLPLVVATGETPPETVRRLRRYLRDGGTVAYVAAAAGRAETLAALAEVPAWAIEEAKVDRYAMLREITFDHPLFAPLAGPQFGDFTKVLFWKHRRIEASRLGEARVLARFESGDAAVIEKAVSKGRLIVLASGWQPADSQLARSSKFVPLMTALLERRTGRRPATSIYHVGDRVPLPPLESAGEKPVVRKPDGSAVTLAPGTEFFAETDQPGIYTMSAPAGARQFAVNLDPMESRTSPLPLETLEQMGCRLVNRPPEAPDARHLRQMRDVELESRQKAWRWLVLAAIGTLLAETWLAGRLNQPRSTNAEAVTP